MYSQWWGSSTKACSTLLTSLTEMPVGVIVKRSTTFLNYIEFCEQKHFLLIICHIQWETCIKMLYTYLRVSQSVDDISQGKEWTVDVSAFPLTCSLCISGTCSLGASEVNQAHFGHTDVWIKAGRPVLLRQVNLVGQEHQQFHLYLFSECSG